MNPPRPRPANKIGRKRRAAGWMLLALGVVVAALWSIGGGEWGVSFGPWRTVVQGATATEQFRDVTVGPAALVWPVLLLLCAGGVVLLCLGVLAKRRAGRS